LRIIWTDERLKEEALKHRSKSEFENRCSGAYWAASKRGILERICSHMVIRGGTSLAEMDLLKEIKAVYPKAQKIKDTKVTILNKPHIRGLDIDIYVPELRKGIEFDGTFWHSPKGLRRGISRKDWPQEDIDNYHPLKDSWFQSKGIQLLHIKEEDWNLDKEACIQRCLEFLGASCR
jgi:hypothetical protein